MTVGGWASSPDEAESSLADNLQRSELNTLEDTLTAGENSHAALPSLISDRGSVDHSFGGDFGSPDHDAKGSANMGVINSYNLTTYTSSPVMKHNPNAGK